MDQVWKGLSNLDLRDPGGFYKKPLLILLTIELNSNPKFISINCFRTYLIKMDQERMLDNLQEPPTKQKMLALDPQPETGQSSTSSHGDRQASTSNTKPQATNEVSDRFTGKNATTPTSGQGE